MFMFLDSKLDQSSWLNGSRHTHSSIWSYVLRECTFHLFQQFVFVLCAYMAQRGTISPACLNHLILELHAWCTLHKTQFKGHHYFSSTSRKLCWHSFFSICHCKLSLNTKGLIATHIQKVYINVLLKYLCSKYTLSRLCRHQAMFPQLH